MSGNLGRVAASSMPTSEKPIFSPDDLVVGALNEVSGVVVWRRARRQLVAPFPLRPLVGDV